MGFGMKLRSTGLLRALAILLAAAALPGLTCCTKKSAAQTSATDLTLDLKTPFRFVAYGDTRFHDANDTEAANPAARRTLVQAIADAHPAFICFTGDIVYNGNDSNDWKVWDSETRVWRDKKIPIYPALGNCPAPDRSESSCRARPWFQNPRPSNRSSRCRYKQCHQ